MMIVAVGSKNPVKVGAVEQALRSEACTIISLSPSSGVREQPLSQQETRLGAIQRAQNCLKMQHADAAFGLEGGVSFEEDGLVLCHWAALVSDEYSFVTCGPQLLLPAQFKEPLVAGRNLDEILLDHTGIENLGSKQGAVGLFTQARVTRQDIFVQMAQILWGQFCFHSSESIKLNS